MNDYKLFTPLTETPRYTIIRPHKDKDLILFSDSDAQKTFIGNNENKKCRFCGKDAQKTSFRKVAHAIPELLGNIRVFSNCECDVCNDFFAREGENDLANLLSVLRPIQSMRGKNGIPVHNEKGKIRVENKNNTINIRAASDRAQVNEEDMTLTLKVETPPFSPINVWRILIKMALSLLPEELEPSDFNCLHRLLLRDKEEMPFSSGIFSFGYVTYPQSIHFPDIQNAFFIRKQEADEVPYALYAVATKSIILFVALPSDIRDKHILNKNINLSTEDLHRYFYRYAIDDRIVKNPLHFINIKGPEKGKLVFTPEFIFTAMEYSTKEGTSNSGEK